MYGRRLSALCGHESPRLAEGMTGVLTSFYTYMRFTHRHGPRTRWRDAQGTVARPRPRRALPRAGAAPAPRRAARARVRARRPRSGARPGRASRARRPLPRAARARGGRARYAPSGTPNEPGPAKRRYELTPAGRELLRAWAKALKQTQRSWTPFSNGSKGGEHARTSSPSPWLPPAAASGAAGTAARTSSSGSRATSATSSRSSPTSRI